MLIVQPLQGRDAGHPIQRDDINPCIPDDFFAGILQFHLMFQVKENHGHPVMVRPVIIADQIPAAGGKPDNGYTEGEWDTVPVTDIELTEDAVYTYIYAEKTEVVKPEYYIVGSADATVTEGDETDVEFTAKRSVDDEHCIDHHKDVILGGVTLKAGRDYSVRHGSTIVTINGSVIKNLKPGVYTVKIIFDDGAVTTNLTVKERTKETTTETATETTTEVITEAATEAPQKPVEKKTDKNAATGDDVNLWIALMMLSMSGTIAMFTVKKKKHK